jgi:hypothetical protein
MVALETRKSKRFCLYDIAVELRGPGMDALAGDFDFFTDRQNGGEAPRFSVTLELIAATPDPARLPQAAAKQVFPECALYKSETDGFVYDYHGIAHLELSRSANQCFGRLICADPALAEELGYLFLQSEIGRFLEAQGLHRVHALGLALPSGKGVLVLLPSGGGKSTLAQELLQREGVLLLSDDTPLVDRLGRLHPYPMRLSFREEAEISPDWRAKARRFERRKHGAKLLVPVSALPAARLPRPSDHFSPGYLVIAERHGSRKEPELSKASAWHGALPLFRDLVIGLGVPQVAELLLTKGLMSLPDLAPAAASRSAAASAFALRARSCRFKLSSDPKKNAACLLETLASFEEKK